MGRDWVEGGQPREEHHSYAGDLVYHTRIIQQPRYWALPGEHCSLSTVASRPNDIWAASGSHSTVRRQPVRSRSVQTRHPSWQTVVHHAYLPTPVSNYAQPPPNGYGQPPYSFPTEFSPVFRPPQLYEGGSMGGPQRMSMSNASGPIQGMFTRNLIGNCAGSAFRLQDTNEKIGIWFVMQDLSVRTEGAFRYVQNPYPAHIAT